MAKKSDQTAKPERAFLRFEHTGQLSPDVQADVNELHRAGVKWESDEAARDAKLEAIADAAQRDSVTVGELRKLPAKSASCATINTKRPSA
jgi:hypothetical protein